MKKLASAALIFSMLGSSVSALSVDRVGKISSYNPFETIKVTNELDIPARFDIEVIFPDTYTDASGLYKTSYESIKLRPKEKFSVTLAFKPNTDMRVLLCARLTHYGVMQGGRIVGVEAEEQVRACVKKEIKSLQ
jgi:hypothetical protein